jgi:hypothetical protein
MLEPAGSASWNELAPTPPRRRSLSGRHPDGAGLADGSWGTLSRLTRDSAGGFVVDGSLDGPRVVSGAILAGDHFELG